MFLWSVLERPTLPMEDTPASCASANVKEEESSRVSEGRKRGTLAVYISNESTLNKEKEESFQLHLS